MSSVQNNNNGEPINELIATVDAAEAAAEVAREEKRKANRTAQSIVKTAHGEQVAAATVALTDAANGALAVYGLGNSPAHAFLGKAFVGEVAKLARRAYK